MEVQKLTTKIIKHENGNIIEWQWAMSVSEDHIPPFFTSCYFIDGILIDSGAPGGLNEFKEFIELIGPNNIEKCLLSHTHEDHSGGLLVLKEHYNIPVFASPKAVSILKTGFTYPEYRKKVWGEKIDMVEVLPFPSEKISSKSEEFSLYIVPTPGHAPEQVSFVEKNFEWAFVTDAILVKYKRIFGGKSTIQEDISQIYNSIFRIYQITERMENLKVFLQGREYVNRDFLKEKLSEIKSLHKRSHELKKQGLTSDEIASEMFGDDLFEAATSGELSHKNLISSLLDWNV